MAYKYQGIGSGPISQKRMRGLIAAVILAVVIYVIWAIVMVLYLPFPAHAAAFKCRGFSFIYTELECEQPPSPATAGAMFCQVYTPVRWSASDTRQTKEQVDSLNRIWKRLCSKKVPPK